MSDPKLTTNTAISFGLFLAACTLVWQAASLKGDVLGQLQQQGSDIKALRRDITYWIDTLKAMNPAIPIPPFPDPPAEDP